MLKYIAIVTVLILASSPMAFAQESDGQASLVAADLSQPVPDERSTRIELKQSVTKMTFESGDRRIIQLPSGVRTFKQDQQTQKSRNSVRETKPTERDAKKEEQITVQCNPLGEAEAIGVLLDTAKTFKERGNPIEVFAPEDSNMSVEKWRRIAELACLEDEI